MTVVKLSGGFGNQLFQYDLARSFKERTGQIVKLGVSDFDPARQVNVMQRHFLLKKITISLIPLASLGVCFKRVLLKFKFILVFQELKAFRTDGIDASEFILPEFRWIKI